MRIVCPKCAGESCEYCYYGWTDSNLLPRCSKALVVILEYVDEHGLCPPVTYIARELGIKKHYAERLLEILKKDGWIALTGEGYRLIKTF